MRFRPQKRFGISVNIGRGPSGSIIIVLGHVGCFTDNGLTLSQRCRPSSQRRMLSIGVGLGLILCVVSGPNRRVIIVLRLLNQLLELLLFEFQVSVHRPAFHTKGLNAQALCA